MPALMNTFLFVEPQQHFLNYGSVVLHDIVSKNRQAGQIITELIGDDATPDRVKQELARITPIVFCGLGHGNSTTFTVECTAKLFDTSSSDLNLLADKVCSLCSCLTAQLLGPAIIDAGAVAYTGYSEEFWFYTADAAGTTRAVQSPFLCLLPDTTIAGGFKPINEFLVGDNVIGINGKQETLKTFERAYDGDVVTVKATGMLPLTTTPEHRLYAVSGSPRWRKWNKNKKSPRTVLENPMWKSASLLKPKKSFKSGDYLLIPKLKGTTNVDSIDLSSYAANTTGLHVIQGMGRPTNFPVSKLSAWLLGLYVAEGFSHTQGIALAFGQHEKELINDVCLGFKELGYTPCTAKGNHSTVVVVPSVLLKRAFRVWCGSGATNKQIPDFILNHTDLEIAKSFIKGYFAGDGALTSHMLDGKKCNRLVATTVSKKLALQLQLLIVKLDALLCIRHNDSRCETIRGKLVHCKERWLLYSQSPSLLSLFGCDTPALNDNHQFKSFGDFVAVPVRDIKVSHYDGMVHNIETPDNTYLANNLVVHNCEFQFVASLLNGKSTGDARADQLARYDEEIKYWTVGDGKDNFDAMELSRILEINKDISVFLGEGGIAPSPPQILMAGPSSLLWIAEFLILAALAYQELKRKS